MSTDLGLQHASEEIIAPTNSTKAVINHRSGARPEEVPFSQLFSSPISQRDIPP